MKNNVLEFLLSRRSVTIKSMLKPKISNKVLNQILLAGLRVPDHGALTPWKIVILKGESKIKFGGKVVLPSFLKKNPDANKNEIELEKKRFNRASIVICVLSCPVKHNKIPEWEMQLSSSLVCYNMLLAAQSMGFAAQWVTGWCAYDERVTQALGGNRMKDKIVGFIFIGGKEAEPKERIRPNLNKIVSEWK